jgi:hypothetical protein
MRFVILSPKCGKGERTPFPKNVKHKKLQHHLLLEKLQGLHHVRNLNPALSVATSAFLSLITFPKMRVGVSLSFPCFRITAPHR